MAISSKPYIGSRDFYPEDMRFRTHMFDVQRRICSAYGYVEYAAPLIEPLDLYRKKSSEEIVGEQLYSFIDRGEREVAIRPEMTPTLARMVSARRAQYAEPLRWFSIANFMRYERPGRGRLREFYQLNVDFLGPGGPAADAEMLMLAVDILRAYGADASMFRLRYSDRRLLQDLLGGLDAQKARAVARLLDKREKIGPEAFAENLSQELGDAALESQVQDFLGMRGEDLAARTDEPARELTRTRQLCEDLGYGEFMAFDPAIVRGFDYYTGMVFEIFDSHPENNRSIFGGGRYDKLVGLFGKHDVPAVGFGLGDVTLQNFLEAHLSASNAQRRGVFVTLFSEELLSESQRLAAELRAQGLEVETALQPTKKLGKQFETADRKGRRFALVLGPEEVAVGRVRIKDLADGSQSDADRSGLAAHLKD